MPRGSLRWIQAPPAATIVVVTDRHSAELSYPARLRGLSVPLARGASYLRGPVECAVGVADHQSRRDDFGVPAIGSSRGRCTVTPGCAWRIVATLPTDIGGVVPGLRVTTVHRCGADHDPCAM